MIGNRTGIFPFGIFADTTTCGRVFYKLINVNTLSRGLECTISSIFSIPNFEFTEAVVITLDMIPQYGSRSSALVSYIFVSKYKLKISFNLHFMFY